MRAVASFDVDAFEQDPPYREHGEMRYARARVRKTFHGDLEGHGSVEMLGAQAESQAGYVAVEYISGSLNGRAGAFALLHISTMDGPRVWGEFRIVPGSGTGDLATIRGNGSIERDAEGHHTFTLDHQLE
jgi:hypothetical protein